MRKALYILADLDDRDIGWLAKMGEVRSFAAGETLIAAGHAVEHLFFLTDGTLEVTGPKNTRLAVLELGEVVGEMSFVEKRMPSATVKALTAARVLAVPRAAMLAEFARDAAMGMRFYRALAVFLSDRLRTASGVDDNELDEGLLDTLSIAGDRFIRLIAMLEGRV
jgi:CRP/FNR family transcriptional regulator, cyclic AMP receptor protein